ncbi:hypothetical protein [Nonomuraea gerenzanensis]|uniref:hypothetical protein n=1 Tax=Nonomuraea gerenzanensis TaxID=93944 RepID=UPI001CD9E5F0|nr:hypothetical protein [Nonomuraea gerenzanensis]UBU10282.1 hypothetical protein LCN96_38865 [Nonomuraea gerenzanensis]
MDDLLDDVLDRHFWIVFPAGALMLGVIPLILLEQALGQPEIWPRVLVGAAIGAGIVAGPTALLLAGPVRRMASGLLALVVSAAVMVAFAMKVPHRRETIPLGDPGRAEGAGTAAMIIVWGAVALLVMGLHGMTWQARGRRHRAWVEECGQDGQYVAVCACGWRGKAARDSSAVFAAAGDHANRVEIAIREQARHRPRPGGTPG